MNRLLLSLFHENTTRRDFFFLVVAVIISRVPFLSLGYGSDGDAWRSAWSARTLWSEGNYHPSRFPGFPLFEILNTPLVGSGGAFLSNSFTLLLFLLGLVVFARLLALLEVRSARSALWTFAFLPLLWKNSAVTHDYIWGLLFILTSLFFLLKNKVIISGIFFGLAVGVRLTHFIILIPIVYYLFSIGDRKGLLPFVLSLCGVSFLCYLPVFLRPEFAHEANNYAFTVQRFSPTEIITFFGYRSVYSIGLLGVLSILVALLFNRKRVCKIFRSEIKVRFVLMGIMSMLLLFLFSPDEREYLIPLIPFLLIYLSLVFPVRYSMLIYICLVSYSFINIDIIEHDFRNQRIAPRITNGFVIDDYLKRIKVLKMREEIARYPFPDSSIVLTGMGPILWFENDSLEYVRDGYSRFGTSEAAVFQSRKEQYIVYELSEEHRRQLQEGGYRIFYIRRMKSYIESFMHLNLDTSAFTPVEITVP